MRPPRLSARRVVGWSQTPRLRLLSRVVMSPHACPMTVTHLARPSGSTLCLSSGRWPVVSADPAAMTCRRCGHALDRDIQLESEACWQREYQARIAAAVTQVGLGEVWAFLTETPDGDDGAYTNMIRGILGSVAEGLVEMGFRVGCSNAAPRASDATDQ